MVPDPVACRLLGTGVSDTLREPVREIDTDTLIEPVGVILDI